MSRTEKLVLLCMTSSLLLTSCSRTVVQAEVAATSGVPVRATQAISRDVPLELSAVGNVEARDSVEVKSRVAGQINRVAFEEGQGVTKGQLLFQIDRNPLERQAAEQQAELERDLALEQQARAVVTRDSAAQKQSESEAEVARKLGAVGILSVQRVDQLVSTSDSARASLQSDQAAIQAAIGTTKADQARLAQTQLQLRFTDVVAPIGGRAGAVLIKAGNMVRENDTTLVTLLQLAPLYVTFGIPEQSLLEIHRLSTHEQLTVEVTSGSDSRHEGRLTFIDNSVDATTGTVRLKATFPNTDEALWPGQFVNVRLRLGIEAGRTLVPASAIQDGLNGKYVWLVKSGVASVDPVTVLRTYKPQTGPMLAVVGSGIHPGDEVVTEGQLRLTDGARISLLGLSSLQPQTSATVSGR